MDVKILAKVLVNCLNALVAKMVRSDQMGFIPGRFSRMNIEHVLCQKCIFFFEILKILKSKNKEDLK